MIRVLFVCLGNICRSPIAEATFRDLVEKRGLSHHIACDSAGTSNYHIGDLPDRRTRRNAESHGLILTHRCRQLVRADFEEFDYIVAMDYANFDTIQAKFSRDISNGQVFLLGKFDPEVTDGSVPAVPDPYYEDDSAFEDVYQMVRRCNEAFLDWIGSQRV